MKIKTNRQSGFTLIELMVVAMIFLMITGLASATFRHSFATFGQDMAVRDWLSMMTLARERAILEGVRYSVQLRPSDNAYFLLRETENRPAGDWERVTGTWGKTRYFPSALTVKGETTEIVFHPNGTATPASFEATQEGRTVKIQVDPIQGKGRVLDES